MATPRQEVVNAIEAGVTRVTRRVELYESDGVTPFYPNGSKEDRFRLIGGNVTIDSNRDERRAIDVVFDNSDGMMKPDADRGLWYDKIIKPYRGVRFPMSQTKPKILIIESTDQPRSASLAATFATLGFDRVDINLNASTLSDLSGYSIIVSDSYGVGTAKAALLKSAFNAGFKIFTQGAGNGVGNLPWVISQAEITNAAQMTITPYPRDTPLAGGWSAEAEGANYAFAHTNISPKATPIAYSVNNSITHPTATIYSEGGAGRWFDYKPTLIGTQAKALFSRALYWLWDYKPWVEWETSLGVFMIDNFSTSSFPNQVPVSGRDLTKKCLMSKVQKAMSFDAQTKVVDFITALGANAGIKNFRFDPSTTETIGTDFSATRGDARWELMSKAANIVQSDLYFDTDGALTMSPFADPSLGSPVASFRTGKVDGNLVSFDRSANDAFLYNHIVVTGTPSSDNNDVSSLGFFGEAINDNPTSPTRVQRIGDRPMFYESPFFTSDEQCVAYANSLLKIHANEQYELNLSSIVYPWIEAGVVIDFKDPADLSTNEPTRFVGQSFTVPLGLEPMTASAKRLVIVTGGR